MPRRYSFRCVCHLTFLGKLLLLFICFALAREFLYRKYRSSVKTTLYRTTIINGQTCVFWLNGRSPEDESQADRLRFIFFLDMAKDKVDVTEREACSIASAAQHHPDKYVILYHQSPKMPINGSNLNVLRMMPNFHTKLLNLVDLFSCTPLAQWHFDGENQVNGLPDHALKAASIYAILHRYGGIYLATDVIVLRPMTQLINSMGYEYKDKIIGSSVMIFDYYHPFIYRSMENVADNNVGDDCLSQPIFTPNFENPHCRLDIDGGKLCKNVTLLRSAAFYPLQEVDWRRQFLPITWSGLDISGSYSVCLYADRTDEKKALPGNNSLIETLAHENCPHIYKRMLSKNEI